MKIRSVVPEISRSCRHLKKNLKHRQNIGRHAEWAKPADYDNRSYTAKQTANTIGLHKRRNDNEKRIRRPKLKW